MRTGRPIPPLKITASEREALERWARGHDRRLASRAAAVLACADGLSNKEVAARCAMTKQTVGKWRARFRATRLQGLYDEPRPGAPRRITEEQVARVIRLTAERAPNGSAWTTRSMAQAVGLTQTAISRIWRTRGVRPAVLAAGANGNGAADPPRDHAPSAAPSDATEDAPARLRRLSAMNALLRDARALRGSGPPELDPLLNLAVEALESALVKHREPVRSTQARAEIALRQARNLLEQAQAAAHSAKRLSENVAANRAAVAAIRNHAERMARRAAPADLRRCPSCGQPYTLRFKVRGVGGDEVAARLRCPRPRCRTQIEVQVPRHAEDVRLDEATGS